MELYIRSLQVIAGQEVPNDIRDKYLTTPTVNLNKNNCKGAIDNGYSYKFNTKSGVFLLHRRILYTTRMDVVGVYGSINRNIASYVNAIDYSYSDSEFFVNELLVDKELIKFLKKYNYTKVNILSNNMFKTLCNSPVVIPHYDEMCTALFQAYLTENYGNIQNLNVLNPEDPLQDIPVEETPPPTNDNVVFVDDTNTIIQGTADITTHFIDATNFRGLWEPLNNINVNRPITTTTPIGNMAWINTVYDAHTVNQQPLNNVAVENTQEILNTDAEEEFGINITENPQ